MKNITEKIEALEAQLKELKQELNKPAFEVGKWYSKTENGTKYILCLTKIDGIEYYGYGMIGNDWETEKLYPFTTNIKTYKPATDKEVEEALIKEANKRGFKSGLTIKRDWIKHDEIRTINRDNKWYFGFSHNCNYLQLDGNVIFEHGKWAEIIKDEPIKIGGYEVEFHEKTCSLLSNFTSIDRYKFSKEFWQAAKKVAEHSKAGVNVGCSKQFPVSLDIINQILDKL